jgi:hypothetical protein
MNPEEFKKLIREEVRKVVSEAAVKLPKNFSITELGNKKYAFEYSKFDLEPTVSQAEQIVGQLRKEFAKIANAIQANGTNGEANIYVRDENIAIGITFTSKLGADAIANVVGGINYRD